MAGSTRLHHLTTTAAAALLFAAPIAAHAEARTFVLDIPAQDLSSALKALAAATGQQVVFKGSVVRGKRSVALNGRYSADDAVATIITASGLSASRSPRGVIVVTDKPLQPTASIGTDVSSPTEDAEREILVTGTRIRGASATSPVISVGQEQIRNGGLADLGDVVRRIPQSFGGGQNPGIGMNVPSASGVDIGGASSVNLRGLGGDATLTLLNGHRLAYSAVLQSVDISTIPVNAVERIEIVPDGASAIYGSDAIAGVANVILRDHYEGLETGVRIAGTSDGGDLDQRYNALAGTSWGSGNLLAAYEYGRNTAIRASQRSFSTNRSPDLDLYPAMRHHSFIAHGLQRLTDSLSFTIDGLYNLRWRTEEFPLSPGIATLSSKDKSFGIAPSFELALPGSWRLSLSGTFGKQRVDYHQVECVTACNDKGNAFYRNVAKSVELGGSGDLINLPAGVARLALGAGYRGVDFRRFVGVGSTVNTVGSQDSYYGYGELSLPLIGPDQNISLARRLSANLAGRFERYPGIGSVFTPKVGALWDLTSDVTIKGSWGKSFRAPSMYQQYQPQAVYLYPPASLGATNVAPTAGALLVVGGNPDLKPERATTWSATLDFHPRVISGLSLQLTYFDVAYRDRVVAPIFSLRQAFSDPANRNQLILAPSASVQAATIASAGQFLNLTGVPYNPANVIAIVNDSSTNAGRQSARGIDALVSYAIDIAPGQRVQMSTDVAYLDSSRQLSPLQPVNQLSGIIFNPPHWRAQGSLGWSNANLTLTGSADFTGGVRDTRAATVVKVGSLTTFDLTARYRIKSAARALGGLELNLSVLNIFNQMPDTIATSIAYDTPYDSTNYSPVGRIVAVGFRKRW